MRIEGLAMVDMALHYVEQQEEVMLTDTKFLKRWRDFGAKK